MLGFIVEIKLLLIFYDIRRIDWVTRVADHMITSYFIHYPFSPFVPIYPSLYHSHATRIWNKRYWIGFSQCSAKKYQAVTMRTSWRMVLFCANWRIKWHPDRWKKSKSAALTSSWWKMFNDSKLSWRNMDYQKRKSSKPPTYLKNETSHRSHWACIHWLVW